MLTILDVEIICLGLGLTINLIEFYKEKEEIDVGQLTDLIDSTGSLLKTALHNAGEEDVPSIERDKMEELSARLKGIEKVLNVEDRDRLQGCIRHLEESVDYAKNRYDEEKYRWFVFYLTGKTVVFAAHAYMGKAPFEIQGELFQIVEDAKIKLLDETADILIRSGKKIPWHTVKNILNNKKAALGEIPKLLSADDINWDMLGTARAPGQFLEKLHEICNAYGEIPDFYMSEAMPVKKERNARECFKIPGDERIIFLCDATVFGSCKLGFAVCEKGLYWAVDWTTDTKRTFLTWKEFATREIVLNEYTVSLGEGDNIGLAGGGGGDEGRLKVVSLFDQIQVLVMSDG